MTNKIKTFCVDTKAEDLTDEQIKQLHQWCVEAGAKEDGGVDMWIEEKDTFPCMGIDRAFDTLAHDERYIYHFNNNIIKFKDTPSYLGLPEEVLNSEESTSVETSVRPSDSFYTKLDTLLTLYPITLSKGISVTSTDIVITHDNFEHDFIVKCEDDLLELLESLDTLNKLSGK